MLPLYALAFVFCIKPVSQTQIHTPFTALSPPYTHFLIHRHVQCHVSFHAHATV